jgi:beta-galactosidase/beta-glucuronidase
MRQSIQWSVITTLLSLSQLSLSRSLAAEWKLAQGPLATRWAKDVSPDKALPEYPRPQMVRKDWQNLNGLWDYAVRPKGNDRPEKFDGQILVPYPVESALSGVMKRIDNVAERLWYRRTFTVPTDWSGKNVLLHFGAVNWDSTVWVNGKKLGEHLGGYDGFDFNITEALKHNGQQEIVVSAWNPADAGTQPRGKQVRKPGGIFYTPSTGIWQTVWIEPVPKTAIDSVTIVPDVDKNVVRIAVKAHGDLNGKHVDASYSYKGKTTIVGGRTWTPAGGAGALSPVEGEITSLTLPVADPILWSPDSPYLYSTKVSLTDAVFGVDMVETYFAMRKVSIAKDDKGVTRIFLNNKPQYMIGPLDQGFWPDGIYTAPTDEALKYDIEMTKKLGYNMARKHVKVEPDRWYYWADKLGLLVWQDMPSGDRSIGPKQPDLVRSPESAKQYDLELQRMIDGRRNHPSIIMWVVFNEGWGQFDTPRVTNWVKEYDPSRLVNCASGWTDRGVGDVHDIHVYPGPGTTKPEEHRAAVLGEFGGLGLPLEGHTWQSTKNWGYRQFKTRDEVTKAYLSLMDHLQPEIADPGMSAAVYTQTTDVETEVNGLMTYDREIVKPDEEQLAAAHRKLFEAATK